MSLQRANEDMELLGKLGKNKRFSLLEMPLVEKHIQGEMIMKQLVKWLE